MSEFACGEDYEPIDDFEGENFGLCGCQTECLNDDRCVAFHHGNLNAEEDQCMLYSKVGSKYLENKGIFIDYNYTCYHLSGNGKNFTYFRIMTKHRIIE